MRTRIFLSIVAILIIIIFCITGGCKDNSTEPETIVDETLRPFAGTWDVTSWLYEEITTVTPPDSSDFISDCGYTISIKVELSRVLTINISGGELNNYEMKGTIQTKDDDELIITILDVPDTVTYHFAPDSSTFSYTTVNLLDFSEAYRCNIVSLNPPNPVPAYLTITLNKAE